MQDDWRIGHAPDGQRRPPLRVRDAVARHEQNPDEPDLDRRRAVAYAGGQSGYPEGLAYPDRNNFAPRVGFSFNPGGGKSVHPRRLRRLLRVSGNEPLVQPGAQRAAGVSRDPDQQRRSSRRSTASASASPCSVRRWSASPPSTRTGRFRSSSRASVERGATGRRQHDDRGRVSSARGGAISIARASSTTRAPSPLPLGPRRPYQTISFVRRDGAARHLADREHDVPGRSDQPARVHRAIGVQRRLRPGQAATRQRSELPCQLHVLEQHDRFAVVPLGSHGARGAAGQLQPRCRLGAGRVRHPSSLRRRSLIYRIRFSRRRSEADAWRRAAQRVLGDWQVAVIHQGQSGFPFTISVFGDTANAGALLNVNPVRANVVPGRFAVSARRTSGAPTGGSTPPPSRRPRHSPSATPGGTACRGPDCQKTDVALQRDVRASSTTGGSTFRAEAFNLFNTRTRHARALREHAAVRQRDHGGHTRAPDSVRRPPQVLASCTCHGRPHTELAILAFRPRKHQFVARSCDPRVAARPRPFNRRHGHDGRLLS